MRPDGRKNSELRPVRITRGFTSAPPGSVLIEMGRTKVLCTASIADGVPDFLAGSEQGWITADYSMLPGSTPTRKEREINRGRPEGRTQEIRRIIGRSLRAAVDLAQLGPRSLWIDCDVLEADGGTRTASVTGGFVALVDALRRLQEQGAIGRLPIRHFVAAVSVGIVNGQAALDLCYEEDCNAAVDLNLVMTDAGEIVEVQGTGERCTFAPAELQRLVHLGWKGIRKLLDCQRRALAER